MRQAMIATMAGLVFVLLAVEVPAQTKTPVPVLLSFIDAEHAGLAYAVARGVYARAGLEVTFTERGQPDDVAKRLAAGEGRFAFILAPAVVEAVSRAGAPIKMIANYQRDREYSFAGSVPASMTDKELKKALHGLGLGLVIHTQHYGERELNCKMVQATSQAWLAARKDPKGAAEAYNQVFEKKDPGLGQAYPAPRCPARSPEAEARRRVLLERVHRLQVM